jgi:hypothetical protein
MLARVRELSGGKTVRVGILADADKPKAAERGKHSKKARTRAKVERRARAAPSLLEVAIIHEFGGGRVPARSFIRATMDEKRAEIVALQVHLAQQVLKGAMTPDQALNALGAKVAAWCQARIVAGIAPPLAASTLRRKKRKTTPLILTGQLKSGITWAVA